MHGIIGRVCGVTTKIDERETAAHFRGFAGGSGKAEIQLRHLSAIHVATVAHSKSNGLARDRQIAVGEGSVAQTVTEWEGRCEVVGVIPTIANMKALGIIDVDRIVWGKPRVLQVGELLVVLADRKCQW